MHYVDVTIKIVLFAIYHKFYKLARNGIVMHS